MECVLYGYVGEEGHEQREKAEGEPKGAAEDSGFWHECEETEGRVLELAADADGKNEEDKVVEARIWGEVGVGGDNKEVAEIPDNELGDMSWG